jgi:hypothetical protein
MNDEIDRAINTADRTVTMISVPIHLTATGGRPVQLAVPLDVTDAEILELIGFLSVPGGLRAVLEANRGPRLVVARGSIPQ